MLKTLKVTFVHKCICVDAYTWVNYSNTPIKFKMFMAYNLRKRYNGGK